MNCCAPPGVEHIFDTRLAARERRRFERRGLPRRARRLLAAIRVRTRLEASRTLEIGGGAGGFSIELLRAGAAHASIIDASPAYVAAARELAASSGCADRIEVEHATYGPSPGEPVDLIVLDRVVCCDPDWRRLLDPATHQARHAIALSWPRPAWWTGLLVRGVNLGLRLFGEAFRMQYHPPAAMLARLREAGFHAVVVGHYWMWELVVATR